MRIETDRLILRPWEESDAESLYNIAKDPEVGPAAGWKPHPDKDYSLKVIREVLSHNFTFAICTRDNNMPIGCISLRKPPFDDPETLFDGELGFWMGKDYWGEGYMKEAIFAIETFAFVEVGYQNLWGGYFDGNEKSKKIQEASGFSFDHTEENMTDHELDEPKTVHYMKISQQDWLEENLYDVMTKVFEKVDVATTQAYYENLTDEEITPAYDLYRSEVVNNYKQLDEFLTRIGVDIKKPYDLGKPYMLEDNIMQYPYAKYVVMGEVDPLFNTELFGTDVSVFGYDRDLEIEEKYFIIRVISIDYYTDGKDQALIERALD